MLKQIIPKKENEAARKKQALTKIFFLFIIGISILLAHITLQIRKNGKTPSPTPAKQSIPQSLGIDTKNENEALQNQIETGVEQVKDTAESVRQELEATTEKVVVEGKKQVEDTAHRFLYDTTLKPLIDKINTLPPQQQDYIKDQICPQQ